MMPLELKTPFEVARDIAVRAKDKRLSLNLSQQSLSSRSGVSLGVVKKFERTGQISLASLLKLAIILDSLIDFTHTFKPKPPEAFATLAEFMKPTRRRGRR